MGQTEAKFLRTQRLRRMVGFRYIDAISIFDFMGKADFNHFNANIQFTYESSNFFPPF